MPVCDVLSDWAFVTLALTPGTRRWPTTYVAGFSQRLKQPILTYFIVAIDGARVMVSRPGLDHGHDLYILAGRACSDLPLEVICEQLQRWGLALNQIDHIVGR